MPRCGLLRARETSWRVGLTLGPGDVSMYRGGQPEEPGVAAPAVSFRHHLPKVFVRYHEAGAQLE